MLITYTADEFSKQSLQELANYSGWLSEEQPNQPEVNIQIDYNLLDMNLSIGSLKDTVSEINERLNSVAYDLSLEDYLEAATDLSIQDNELTDERLTNLKEHINAVVEGACNDFDAVNNRIDAIESKLQSIEQLIINNLSNLDYKF